MSDRPAMGPEAGERRMRLAATRTGRYLLTLAIWAAIGCGRGPVLSPGAYELARAVDNLCNLRDAKQIPQAKEILREKLAAGTITQVEHEALASVLEVASKGGWEDASAATRRMLVDQNR